MKQNLQIITFIFFFLSQSNVAQTIDFGSFQGNPFKIGGGVSAGATYFNSNRGNGREPFVYNFTGNLNVSFYSFSMPISYNFTNLGGKLNYQIPFNFNRLSLNPRYKWVSAYVGDVAMTFSPYSLAGHQFTGGGIELTPDSPFKISAMYGRLLKAVNDDGNPNSIPSFERWGYGSKLEFIKSKYKVGLVGFYAKDLENSITQIPSANSITPKENLVVGLTFESQINNEFKLYADYSNSSLVQDTRATGKSAKSGLASLFLNGNSSTQNFNAYKVGFDYRIQKTTLGASFERVDPNYKTLGAYFFANDLQNIMVNAARPLFNNKVNLTFNAGIQRDNLDNKKAQTTNRLVGTLNMNIKFNDRFTTSINFSNQTTTTNVNPDQFIQINQVNPELNQVDQINYRQLSRNASFNANYALPDTKRTKRTFALNYAFNQVANEQGGVIRLGQLSSFHNVNTFYSLFWVKSKWALNSSLNFTHNTIGKLNSTTIGPVIGVNKKFLKDKLVTQFATAFNTSKGETSSAQNFNFRLTSNYKLFEEHHFNAMISQVMSSTKNQSTASKQFHDLTITFGYSFNFSGTKKKEKEENSKKEPLSAQEKEKFKVTLNTKEQELDAKGIKTEINNQIAKIDFEGLTEEQKDLKQLKDSVFNQLDQFDIEKDEAVKSKMERQIQNTVALFETKAKVLENFTLVYATAIANASTKMTSDIAKRDVTFNADVFVKRYKMNAELVNKTIEHLPLFEETIVNNNIKISKKDLFVLAHFDLVELLQQNTFDNMFKEEVTKQKQNYYSKFQDKNKLDGVAEELEVHFLRNHLKQYAQKLKQKI